MATCKECGQIYAGSDVRSKVPATISKTGEGVVVIQGEAIVHSCPTVSRAEIGNALKVAGAAMFNPPPGMPPYDPRG